MKYIINLVIIFDPDQRTLALNNNPLTAIELTKPSCRVFNELIKKPGTTLTRDELLKNAWEDFGIPSSNASLNNCISELRKAFINLGIEDKVIVTAPRIGFKLEANIHPVMGNGDIEPVEQPQPVKNEGVNLEESTKSIKKERTTSGAMLFSWLRRNYILSASIVLVIVIASIAAGVSYMPTNQLNLVSNYKLCDIYSLGHDKKPPSFATRAEQMLKKTTIDCSQEKQDVFYIERRTENDRFKVMFIAACIKSASETYQYCNNFKIIE